MMELSKDILYEIVKKVCQEVWKVDLRDSDLKKVSDKIYGEIQKVCNS